MANQALPKHRNALLKMAQVWEILAHDRRKKLLRRCPNIARTSQARRNAHGTLGAAWRDGCATGMREEAEEAAEIIKTSGLADRGILDRLAEHVRRERWSDEEPD